jgi:hypothetical protein
MEFGKMYFDKKAEIYVFLYKDAVNLADMRNRGWKNIPSLEHHNTSICETTSKEEAERVMKELGLELVEL